MHPILIVLISLALTACGPNELESQLKEQKKSAQLRYDNLQIQLDSSKNQKSELNQKINLVTSKLKQSNEQLEEERKQNLTLKNSIQLLQLDKKSETMEPLNNPTIDALKNQLQESQTANNSLKQEISRIIKELREKTSQFKSVQSQVTEANTQQQMLEQQLQEYKVNNSELNNQLQQQSNQEKSVVLESTTHLEQLKQQLKSSQEGNITLKENLAQIRNELTEQSAKLDNTFLKYTELELKLSNTITQLKEALEKQKLLETELANSNQQLTQTQQKLASAEKEIMLVNQNYNNILARNDLLENQNKSSMLEISELHQALGITQANYKNLKDSRGLYTVQPNDSLSSIAAYFYRNGNQWVKIWKANQLILKKPDLIYTGLVLTIPQINGILPSIKN